jgi:hypothetical protein
MEISYGGTFTLYQSLHTSFQETVAVGETDSYSHILRFFPYAEEISW